MAPRKTEAAEHGLRLTLPGAPNNAHTIPGVPGFYWPDRPTPVGGPGDPVGLDQARALAADPGVHLELVPVTDPDTVRARYHAAAHAAAGDLRAARRLTEGDEAAVITDQLAAASDHQED
jgi:hypothetical protein